MARKKSLPINTDPILPSFFGTKVVSAAEMARVEKLAEKEGCREEDFIEGASKAIATSVLRWVKERSLAQRIFLLIGKGNKGADAYATGALLLEEGFQATAFACFPKEECSEWNRKFSERFLRRKGKIVPFYEEGEMPLEKGVILDGLLGTGFQGRVSGVLERAIRFANRSKLPILAIDLPWGLNGTTGEVKGACILAEKTVTLGLAKSGLFFRDGWNQAGQIEVGDFGLPKLYAEKADEIAYLPDFASMPLPKIARKRHKYEAGYVVGFSGSKRMRGAPKMAGLAAPRAGAGIVRIFHREEIGEAPPELLLQKWNQKEWVDELKQAKAVFAGPGTGVKSAPGWLKGIDLPIVLDADFLQKGIKCPRRSILTPHRGEMLRLLGLKETPLEEEFLARSEKFAEKNKTVLVLKGAPTFIFASRRRPLIIPRGDPGMASAGSGDVLTGILAAFLAQGLEPYEAAASGTLLHAIAGEIAGLKKTSYSVIASDLIEALPQAFQEWLDGAKS